MRTLSLLAAFALSLAACGGDDDDGQTEPTAPALPATAAVAASGSANTFTPAQVSIRRTGTVTWTFGSPRPHNVIFNAGTAGAPADIPGNNTNVEVSRTFNTAGTFNYICSIHGAAMSGTVTVQ